MDSTIVNTKKKNNKNKKKKINSANKCYMPECNQTISSLHQLIGKCGKCSHIFCTEHRLPEAHCCPCLTDGGNEMTQDEKNKLIASMKCVATQI